MKQRSKQAPPNNLATFLREKRLAAQMSQGEVAKKFGFTTPQFVSNWERGISAPPVPVVKKLVGLYKMSLEEVYEHFLTDTIARETLKLRKAFGKIS